MLVNRPLLLTELQPIAGAGREVREVAARLRVAKWFLIIGLLLIIVGELKPLEKIFLPHFRWISLIIGSIICLIPCVWIFQGGKFMTKSDEKKWAYLFGTVFVLVLILIAVLIPNPTPFQYTVFRIVLALSAAGVASMIPGFLHLEVSKWIRAGGALAIFVIVYFYSPASLILK